MTTQTREEFEAVIESETANVEGAAVVASVADTENPSSEERRVKKELATSVDAGITAIEKEPPEITIDWRSTATECDPATLEMTVLTSKLEAPATTSREGTVEVEASMRTVGIKEETEAKTSALLRSRSWIEKVA